LFRLIPKGWGPSPSVLILVCTAFPYSDYYAPSDFPGRHPTFIRLSPSYFHHRWHPSWDLPCSPCRTQTRCWRWRVARCPFHALWLPRLSAGYVRLTCGVPRAFDAPALGHPTPSNRWEVSALSLTSQAREVRVRFTRRAMHASCDSPWHRSAKRRVLDTCLLLTSPFRSMLLTWRGGPPCFTPRAHGVPVYSKVLRHSYSALSRRTVNQR
jgi:hypothetical protein